MKLNLRSYSSSVQRHFDEVVSNLQADDQQAPAKSAYRTGNTKIEVRVTSADDDVTCGRACAVDGGVSVRSGMPATCSPTVTLLQKRRGI